MSTIRDVAKEVGCSTATVSRALSNPEKVSKASLKRIHAAIEKLQYRPNMLSQQFRNKQANTIVILVPDIANLFFSTVISGIENVAQSKGFNVLLGDTRDSSEREKSFINLVETKQADGVIQLRPYSKNSMLPKKFVTAVNACGCEDTPYPAVRIDNADAARQVTEHLISLGHKKIGLISGLTDNPHTIDRLKGYKQALAQAGIEFDPALVAEGDFTLWSGLNASEHFIRMTDRPTAIFSMNDEMAIGAMKGLKAKGLKIPEDISIAGFDDLEFSKYSDPPLTTVAQPAEKLGEKSAELLFQLIDGETSSQNEYVLPVEFIIRQSTAPPRS
ncbi:MULTISPECIES: LacI family DNA-binding transcriptional regulator [Thalassomonas]|uniref:LacI family DNA-binding transcriptional regulator n=1 Tax=Thalassomonas actiniarum TaxID=485447 RepID=A0AAE9YQB6_9GAMM|nr:MULTISPECIES: LacI family DNA-binding transcriptional regulator [Thalassomonas]WDD98298.1 LacI family DNA-binding transcriptional regulator [Thalassomonas actiniarum]